jgi:hypothetical protein
MSISNNLFISSKQLHSGASSQRIAIRVLERLGYPAAIISEALATVSAAQIGAYYSPSDRPGSRTVK